MSICLPAVEQRWQEEKQLEFVLEDLMSSNNCISSVFYVNTMT